MNHLRSIIFSILIFLCLIAAAQQKKKKTIIFNGHFFNELPAAVKSGQTPQDMQMFFIETPDGTKAVGMYSPSVTLSDSALRYAVPVENVAEGAELLRRYNEQKERSKGISLSLEAVKPLIKAGDTFPAFNATDIEGRIWTDAEVRGKVMVLNLWYTGCGPCRREMPELSEWKDEMPDVMFFSATYEAPEIARPVIEKMKFNWIPLVSDTQFQSFIGNNGYPLTIVIDKSGHIAAFEYGTSPEQRASLKAVISGLR
ncbi:MAG: TlpA family protein disulfide reductase [Muribaculaceae bacterium]|nr:TlpA family protein disulfide reductase [Muribaculaceae bacterium]